MKYIFNSIYCVLNIIPELKSYCDKFDTNYNTNDILIVKYIR